MPQWPRTAWAAAFDGIGEPETVLCMRFDASGEIVEAWRGVGEPPYELTLAFRLNVGSETTGWGSTEKSDTS